MVNMLAAFVILILSIIVVMVLFIITFFFERRKDIRRGKDPNYTINLMTNFNSLHNRLKCYVFTNSEAAGYTSYDFGKTDYWVVCSSYHGKFYFFKKVQTIRKTVVKHSIFDSEDKTEIVIPGITSQFEKEITHMLLKYPIYSKEIKEDGIEQYFIFTD